MSTAKPSQRILAGPALRVQPDGRLVTLAREGSDRAVEEIVRRYRPALLRYAATIVPVDRADDVVQESFTRALPGIESSTEQLHLRGWLYTIVRNTALNNLRDAGPRHEQLDESYDGVEQPPQAIDRRERVHALVAGLQSLPEAQREALVKREMEGMSHSEIAVELGVSAGAARQLIFRARNALRDGFGLIVPMPVLRHLVEPGTMAEAGAAGGGAIALKATVAMLATGAAVTAGVAIKSSDHHRSLAGMTGGPSKANAAQAPRRGPAPSSPRHLATGEVPTTPSHDPGPVASRGFGGRASDDRVGGGHGGRGGSSPGGGETRGQEPSGTGPHHGGGALSGGGATEDGGGNQASGDGAGAADAAEADGEGPSGGTPSDSGDGISSGGSVDGSSSGDGSSEAGAETQSDLSSTDSTAHSAGG